MARSFGIGLEEEKTEWLSSKCSSTAPARSRGSGRQSRDVGETTRTPSHIATISWSKYRHILPSHWYKKGLPSSLQRHACKILVLLVTLLAKLETIRSSNQPSFILPPAGSLVPFNGLDIAKTRAKHTRLALVASLH